MGEKVRSGSGMNIPYHISESLEIIFWDKILKFFDADPGSGNFFDPGSGMEKIRIRDVYHRLRNTVYNNVRNKMTLSYFTFLFAVSLIKIFTDRDSGERFPCERPDGC